ncbi:MAG TPA: aminoacyl-tRNA hydrolase [Rhizomicrobium sp.]|jgi:PTH1 family peptidyl-tRNA hydrolase|nr:aminoacyl-tRNA hydrolase [Rhizomicrobium sp.]
MSSDTALLIAGLGNPGDRYACNRHNAGFIIADEIHAHYRFGPWKAKFEAFLSEGTLAGRKVHLLKPQTYMNNSGVSVGAALRFFKLPLTALVVIHDEIDLAAGKIKAKTGGGDAGQNGLRSITENLGPDYRRVRVGVGHPGEKSLVTAHVLQNFSKEDITWLRPLVGAMVEAAPLLAQDDDAGFMTKVALLTKPPKPENKKPDDKKSDKKPDKKKVEE